MQINSKLSIVRTAEGNFVVDYRASEFVFADKTSAVWGELSKHYTLFRNTPKDRRAELDCSTLYKVLDEMFTASGGVIHSEREMLISAMKDLIQFFTEFQFEPNFRFVNSLSHAIQAKTAKDYIINYFSLIDSPYRNEICEKIKSPEFSRIVSAIEENADTKSVVNSRFKIYYGSQGTGKTTFAMKETDGRCMVCNSSMLPSDLMEDFVFVDGKATFQPSALWRSMVEGTKIVLDEINLLPFDSLRFLQTILDGKKEFLYKGNKVEIAEGFQIIGTMNLTVNGMTYGLPEPLIDRAAEMKKFSLRAEDLLTALE